jgi:hypothetical protein
MPDDLKIFAQRWTGSSSPVLNRGCRPDGKHRAAYPADRSQRAKQAPPANGWSQLRGLVCQISGHLFWCDLPSIVQVKNEVRVANAARK